MTLDLELSTYTKRFDEMYTQHPGQYVVIKGAKLEHFTDSYEAAIDWAYDQFGLERFFVKRVSADHDVAHFTRDLGPCRP